MSPSLHQDALAILARLKQEGITALYHFTSVENLSSICQMGALCSKQMLEDAGLWPCPVPGGNGLSHSLDRSMGNWDKVSLNLTSYTPMAYRRKREQHLCFFLVSPEVAALSGIVFANSNAAGTSDQIRREGISGLNNIQFDVMRSVPRPWDERGWKRPVQAEVLVPSSIPFSSIFEVVFVSRASMDYGRRYLCQPFSHPKFSVKAECFTDSPHAMSSSINFAYVKEFLLCDPKVKQNMVFFEQNKYSKSLDHHVKIMAEVKALAGTERTFLLANPTRNIEKEREMVAFPRNDLYHHTCNIDLHNMEVGNYLLKYFLGELCWAVSTFEVVP